MLSDLQLDTVMCPKFDHLSTLFCLLWQQDKQENRADTTKSNCCTVPKYTYMGQHVMTSCLTQVCIQVDTERVKQTLEPVPSA
jgi:Tfp pilus assembly protein PilV